MFNNDTRQKLLGTAPALCATVFAAAGSIGVISGGSWASIAIGGSLLLWLSVFMGQGRMPKPDSRILSWLVLFFGCAALACFHAVDVPSSLRLLLRLATILIPLSLLSSPEVMSIAQGNLRHVPKLTLLSIASLFVLVWMLLVAIENTGPDGDPVTKLNRGFSYLIMLFAPLCGYLAFGVQNRLHGRGLLLAFLAVVVGCLFVTHSRAAQMGFAVASVVFVAALVLPNVTRWGLAALSVLSALWPWAASYVYMNWHHIVFQLPRSWVHRVEIWDNLYFRILESPLFGHGLGSTDKLDWLAPHGAMQAFTGGPAAHPHNAMVQLWVDMGLWGAGLGVLTLLLVLKAIGRLSLKLQALALATFAYAYSLLMSAYNLWTDSLWGALALTVFAFAVVNRELENKKGAK